MKKTQYEPFAHRHLDGDDAARLGDGLLRGKRHTGKRVATAEGRLEDAAGKLYAHASTTCIILGPEKA
jgi:acyl-coenzyme A thioesterase PaaI-like protein